MPLATLAGNVDEISAAIEASLRAKNIPPTKQWLDALMPSVRLNTPLLALQKTALFRLLATDLKASIQASTQTCFPTSISDPSQKEIRVNGPVPVQVLDIEDIGRSRWSQVEAIEMDERGETTKGREIIRVAPDTEESNPNSSTNVGAGYASSGPHKLLLEDARGTKVYAFELESVKGIDISMSIGAKLLLKDVTVGRGVILLKSNRVEILGGKIEAWDKKWRDERKSVLKEKAGWTEAAN